MEIFVTGWLRKGLTDFADSFFVVFVFVRKMLIMTIINTYYFKTLDICIFLPHHDEECSVDMQTTFF